MARSPIPLISFEEYLTLEEKAHFKNEFYQGQILAMSGGTLSHERIAMNVRAHLRTGLLGKDCEVLGDGLLFRTGLDGLAAYPDAVVFCGEIKLEDHRSLVARNPKVVIEVLSPSTEGYDRTTKAREYWRCPSVEQYFLIRQDQPFIEIQSREADGKFTINWIEGRESDCPFASLGLSIPMADIYERVNF